MMMMMGFTIFTSYSLGGRRAKGRDGGFGEMEAGNGVFTHPHTISTYYNILIFVYF